MVVGNVVGINVGDVHDGGAPASLHDVIGKAAGVDAVKNTVGVDVVSVMIGFGVAGVTQPTRAASVELVDDAIRFGAPARVGALPE